MRTMQQIHRATREALTQSHIAAVALQDNKPHTKSFLQGDLVFHQIHASGEIRNKVENKFHGPFRILQVKHSKALCKDIQSAKETWYHFDTLKKASSHYQPI